MSTSYIDEYLVRLGATVDQSGMARFHTALREASLAADASAMSIAGAVVKAQTEIVGGFVAMGSAVVGLVDKVAMADQQYRLFALHMYMSKDAARSLKVAMDALGEPLENLTWDKELRDRTHQLVEDQRAMAPSGDFEGQMRKIRDIRFEFTRMEVEGQYLAMHVVQDFLKALGFGPDELLGKLRKFNDWVTHDLPNISQRLVSLFMPVWHDIADVAVATGKALEAVGLAFTNIIGAITGDSSIEGATFNFEKFAGALQHVVHWFALFAETVDKVVEVVADLTAGLAALFSSIPAPILDAAIGAVVGGVAGGPLGAVGGALAGVAIGPWGMKQSTGGGAVPGGNSQTTSQQAAAVAQTVSKATGIPADLLWSQWAFETDGFKHLGGRNNVAGIRIPGTKTYQDFGSLDDFGDRYAQVVKNQKRYAGLSSATSSSQFAHILKAGGYFEGPEDAYAAGVGRYQGVYRQMAGNGQGGGSTSTIGSVTINIRQQPGEDGKQLAVRVRDTLHDQQNKRVQRNLAEFQDPSWGY